MNKSKPLSVQSYCFRSFTDIDEIASMTTACGLTGIEVCNRHADFTRPESFGGTAARFRGDGIPVTSIGVNTLTGSREHDRPFFESAAAAGLALMSVNFKLDGVPECLATAESLAEEFDLKLGIHNHGGRHWLGSRESLAWVFGRTGKRIGLCLDTAWALDAGENPVEMVRQFGERLYVLHLKDFVFAPSGESKDVVVGTGNLDLGRLDAALAEIGFNGVGVLEYEGDSENPVPALKECVVKIRREMSHYGQE